MSTFITPQDRIQQGGSTTLPEFLLVICPLLPRGSLPHQSLCRCIVMMTRFEHELRDSAYRRCLEPTCLLCQRDTGAWPLAIACQLVCGAAMDIMYISWKEPTGFIMGILVYEQFKDNIHSCQFGGGMSHYLPYDFSSCSIHKIYSYLFQLYKHQVNTTPV